MFELLMVLVTLLIIFAFTTCIGSTAMMFMEHSEEIRVVKYKYGIILNPFKLTFLVYTSKRLNRYTEEFPLSDIIMCMPGCFVLQFVLSNKEKKEKERLAQKLYRKMYNKYIKE